MAEWRNTFYTELQIEPTSPNERWGDSSTSITRSLLLANGSYQTRVQAAYDIIGYCVTNNLTINRVTPMYYPAPIAILPPGDVLVEAPLPSFSKQLYAVNISRTTHKGVTFPGALVDNSLLSPSSYTKSVISVEFSTLPYLIKTDSQLISNGYINKNGGADEGKALAAGWLNSRYIARHLTPFSHLNRLPAGAIKNVGGIGWFNLGPANNLPKELKVGISKREGGATVDYTWFKVPLSYINWSTIGSTLGKVNDAFFDSYPAETLLLDNVGSREYEGPFGERYADIQFKMIYMPNPSTGLNFGTGPNGGKGTKAGTQMGWNYIYDILNGVDDYYLMASDPAGAVSTTGISLVTSPFKPVSFPAIFNPP